MGWWLAGVDDQMRHDWIKRFDPRFWTVNFGRPMMASVTTTAVDALRIDCVLHRANDLAGLIWESEDRHDHPLLRYATSRDYRGCKLRFRWRSGGINPLNAVYGPTLTVEGRDAQGQPRAWYVRLWNYADGDGDDAVVTLDFDDLQAGFGLPGEPVWSGDIDRLFISLVAPAYDGSAAVLSPPVEGWVIVDNIVCEGGGSTIAIGDAMVPPHDLRLSGGYDDSYHLTPARVLRGALHLGYRKWIDHYVGMSHWFALRWDGARFVAGQPGDPLCTPCRRWHADFAARALELGYDIIWSLSYEVLDQHAPEAWKQRVHDGAPALTGWSPPSTLLSPANGEAMAYLRAAAVAFAGIAAMAGMPVHFQIGEPWWWTGFGADRRPCFYDVAAKAAYTAQTGRAVPPPLIDARDPASPDQLLYLDWLGDVLGASTLALRDAVKTVYPSAKTYLLFYAPQVLEAAAPNLARVNRPMAWACPAFDVLQLEDYDFVTTGDAGGGKRAVAAVETGLGYPRERQHYFAGFVLNAADRALWERIADATDTAFERGVAETFVWAYPQVARDGFTYFQIREDRPVQPFHDVRFPLEVGKGASVAPAFATDVAESASGYEQRNARWADARMTFDAGLGVRSEADVAAVLAFFRARRGRAVAFRFRDPIDHASGEIDDPVTAFDQRIGTGDGARTRFELIKRYGEGSLAQVRRITRPEPPSVRVAVDGVELSEGWSLDAMGLVDFNTPPPAGAAVTAGFRFDVPVRFAEDQLELSLVTFRAGEIASIPLVEVREV